MGTSSDGFSPIAIREVVGDPQLDSDELIYLAGLVRKDFEDEFGRAASIFAVERLQYRERVYKKLVGAALCEVQKRGGADGE